MITGTSEAIRLIIWDLDDTFWRGTLTEGGIREYVQAHHDLIITLANRGIISSICSKNDHDRVEAYLREQGIWDYFVFPSINWEPKGPRLRGLSRLPTRWMSMGSTLIAWCIFESTRPLSRRRKIRDEAVAARRSKR